MGLLPATLKFLNDDITGNIFVKVLDLVSIDIFWKIIYDDIVRLEEATIFDQNEVKFLGKVVAIGRSSSKTVVCW